MKKAYFLLLFFFFAVPLAVGAETGSSLFITWKANTLFPSNFQGKALPSPGTSSDGSGEMAKNGIIADPTKTLFTWSVDGRNVVEGMGKNTFTFSAEKNADSAHFVRVTAETGAESVNSSINVPVVTPFSVIETPFPFNIIPKNSKVFIRAVPYFFNVSSLQDLLFGWQMNDFKTSTKQDNVLSFDVGDPNRNTAKEVNITSYTQNSLKDYEIMITRKTLTISP